MRIKQLNSNSAKHTLGIFYLILLFVFGVIWGIDMFYGITYLEPWHLPILIGSQAIQLTMLRTNINVKIMSNLNMLFILSFIQFVLISIPTYYHVVVYWTALIPILAIATSYSSIQSIIWYVATIVLIVGNGLYLNHYLSEYTLTLHPLRFMIGGSFYVLLCILVASMYGRIKKMQQQISVQNSEKIKSMMQELQGMNEHLEDKVKERTQMLKKQNDQLTKYAYMNSHYVRAPLASILGLINLIGKSEDAENEKHILEKLKGSADHLDKVIKEMNLVLDQDKEVIHLLPKPKEEKTKTGDTPNASPN